MSVTESGLSMGRSGSGLPVRVLAFGSFETVDATSTWISLDRPGWLTHSGKSSLHLARLSSRRLEHHAWAHCIDPSGPLPHEIFEELRGRVHGRDQ
jgi:hypothetical protein